jgi:pentatricopeptide repeat protein
MYCQGSCLKWPSRRRSERVWLPEKHCLRCARTLLLVFTVVCRHIIRNQSADGPGHYERKLKHLNKQKEGKKRLKKLAGNIDIPQSAFFDVLSSRPRTFSTSARRFDQATTDHFSAHFPKDLPPPTIDLSYVMRASPVPFAPSSLTTAERSQELSELHRLISEEKPDAVAIVKTFDELASTAPHSHVFTIAELTGTLRALAKIDKQQQHLLRSKNPDILKVHAELEALSAKANRGVELALLQTIGRTVDSSSVTALADIDSQMATLFPRIPSNQDERGMKRYRLCANHILKLCALAGDAERFDKWRSRLSSLGSEQDSYSALATLTLAAKGGDAPAVISAFTEISRSIALPSEHIILLNYTLWQLATRGHWQRVLPTLYRLAPGCPPLDLPGVELGEPLSVMVGSKATAQTFSAIMHALAYQGQFDASLTIFRVMIEHESQPHVPEYQSLFKGFARHGVVPPTSAGRLASSFPLWERFDSPSEGQRGNHAISQMWQRDPSAPAQTQSLWTYSNLREIFNSFMNLSPSADYSQAPTPDKIWIILMAFARCTNGDEATSVEVWESMEAKFAGTENGWWGWSLDGRLRRLRAKMLQTPDEDGVD